MSKGVRYGDGWLPVAHKIAEVVDGHAQLRALAEQAGRDPDPVRVTVLGATGQWRTRRDIDEFERVGVEQVVIWLDGRSADDLCREMHALAATLLA